VSVKARLTIAFAVLLAVAATVVGFAVVNTTRASLVDEVDDQLRERGSRRPQQGRPPNGGDDADDRYEETAEIFIDADGDALATPAGFADDPEPLPTLPPFPSEQADQLVGRIVTRGSDGGPDYRVLVQELPNGGYRVLAAPLSAVDATVSDLLRTVLITAGAVVLIGAATAWVVVRRGLRPVDRMVDTATAIAGGDLSQRVDHRPDDRSELGRLAVALDDMLTQLEAAFAEREETQARLERFVGDASHELRTPVAAIRGYAELYRRGGIEDDEALARAMGRIESESERVGSLVEDLLLLARLDEHRPLDKEAVDLSQLANDAVSDLRAVDPDRPVTLDADEPVVVDGDERRLRQVVANLLTNARVHTPAGTAVRVAVATEDGQARLTVTDEGPGIAAEDQPRLFERFYRADKSRARASGGSGLGLSIVAGVVAAHGGRVELDSTPGNGTTVIVWLPRSSDSPEPAR